MKARHERVVGVMLDAIKYFLKVEDKDIWLDQSMKTVQRVDEVRDHNFKNYGWNEEILALRPDITFWKRDTVDGIKVKTLWLLDITVPFGRILEDGSNSLSNKWRLKLLKYNPLQSAVFSFLKDCDNDGYKLDVKTGFIVISSLGAVYGETPKTFKRIIELDGKPLTKSLCNIWMEKFVVEALKGSFNLWIKACPRTIGEMDPKETLTVLQTQNENLGIAEDHRQICNDCHVSVLNALTIGDEVLENKEKLHVLAPEEANELIDSGVVCSDFEEDLNLEVVPDVEETTKEEFEMCTINVPEYSDDDAMTDREIATLAGMQANDEGAAGELIPIQKTNEEDSEELIIGDSGEEMTLESETDDFPSD
jgi:hypothetical protein